jgi:hypothetical protein
VTFTCANVIAVQVKETFIAPACCSGVGLGGEGNEDWDALCYEAGRAAANVCEREVVREDSKGQFNAQSPFVQGAACKV